MFIFPVLSMEAYVFSGSESNTIFILEYHKCNIMKNKPVGTIFHTAQNAYEMCDALQCCRQYKTLIL
jgi:hypothetical protein